MTKSLTKHVILFHVLLIFVALCEDVDASETPLKYPEVRRNETVTDEYHGTKVSLGGIKSTRIIYCYLFVMS